MIAEPSMPERRPSPGLALNLNSNNPFRNRAGSPAFPSPALETPTSAGARPASRNPFLQAFESEFNKEAARAPDLINMSATMQESPKKATFGASAEEFFNNLTLDDKPANRAPPPPKRSGTQPIQGHRPSRSEEEDRRMRSGPRGPPRERRGGPSGPPGMPNSPERSEHRRPRRNSEASMVDKGSLDAESERRRRERRKERDARAADKPRSTKVRKPQGLDLIDKLDVSGIYGPSLFHHDGPFDACNPHRNKRKDHRAPMQAFPKNSANNALGGSGPINKNIDLEAFHGRGAEGFTDYGSRPAEIDPYKSAMKRPEGEGRSLSFNPKDRGDIIHGEESYGLGTSTFLEGAPASRTAIQRRESENEAAALQNGGLGRKKSIAQRIRGISQPRRGFGDGNPQITSPDARWGGPNARTPGSPPPQAQSAGGYAKVNETNPFFDDYGEAYDRKGAAIKMAESGNKGGPSARSDNSPGRNGLTRTITADGIDYSETGKSSNGFLSRVKSLKGGRKPRERPT
ncbi:Pal1-domain-containing protein [Delitschia confertaspora ATCC 74209]|uniref:Pal1-domain-containing protein n=1 Tax=Delitschia confertaspora ATCC 74209 TaxID=1513339 RepID=A0A9P4JIP5_9PLEO|nr:Pal1-domain-containing protein [Delitschia confertaspora ATCC 74209]